MRVLSLFDGISCGRVALERANIKVDDYFASEIDKAAINIAKKNFPDTVHIGDVTTLNDDVLNKLGHIDLMIGGSPCQDLSIAKIKREGLEGERSKLFYEYVRILEKIKPTCFLFENVGSMKNKDKDVITEILGVEPIDFNSNLVSAQNRGRYYWTDISGVKLPVDRGVLLRDILEENVEQKYFLQEECKYLKVQSKNSKTGMKFVCGVTTLRKWLKNEENEHANFSQGNRVYSVNGKSASLNANSGGLGRKTGLYYLEDNRPFSKKNIRRLTPIECERLQTLPDNYTEGISETQRYKTLGNGWTVDVIAHILKNIGGINND